MSEGISKGAAQGIATQAAQKAANQVRNELNQKIDRVGNRVSSVEKDIKQLRNEMGEVADAIQNMGKTLAGKIDKLNTAASQQLDVTKGTAETNRRILNTNSTGFAANVAANESVRRATNEVNGSVARNTSALVEMEYLRLYNEARAPMRFVSQFAGEIESRFQKAVENVYLNRELYDEHFNRIFDESESKVRTIGEHIFQILEEDFQPTVERRLQVPRSAYQELSLAVDRRRIDERSRQLDADLATLYDETLEPLLEMHHEFETEVAANYSVDAVASDEEVLIPAGITTNIDGGIEFFVGTKLEGAPDRDDGLHYRLAQDASYGEIASALSGDGGMVKSHLKPKNMVELSGPELEALKARLEHLASEGKIDPELLEGYQDYLDNFGLRTLHHGVDLIMSVDEVTAVHQQTEDDPSDEDQLTAATDGDSMTAVEEVAEGEHHLEVEDLQSANAESVDADAVSDEVSGDPAAPVG